jgi:RNA recognition motif-containing protein
MIELDGHDMLGRPIKIKPGVAKSAERAAEQTRTPFASPMSRWRPSEGSTTSSTTSFAKVNNNDSSQRVYVGGLPRLTEPESVQSNMRTFFQGYNVYVCIEKNLETGDRPLIFCNSVCPFRY